MINGQISIFDGSRPLKITKPVRLIELFAGIGAQAKAMETLCGVAIVGRPLSRHLDDGETLEVLRLCTDGTFNACSILYGRCARVAKEMGYSKIITYILEEETGTSLKASGWKCEAEECGGGSWMNCSRRIEDRTQQQMSMFEEREKYPIGKKKRWSRILNEEYKK